MKGAARCLPEHLTPLPYTAAYAELTPLHRDRYNRLQALYFNEQIAFFECAVGSNVLAALIVDPALGHLHDDLRRFRNDEERHTAMFRRWNRQAAPALYAHRDFRFVRVPQPLSVPLGWITRHPRRFPMLVWLMLLQEERALYYAREILRYADILDPSFVILHRTHLADEVHHVRWDEELLDILWRHAGAWQRKVNAGLFRWMMREFFGTPKRAQVRVLDELARQCPELRNRLPEMRRQLRALAYDRAYPSSLYSRESIPRSFARFDAWPEMRSVAAQLAGDGL